MTGYRQICYWGHGRSSPESGVVPPPAECDRGAIDEGHECGGGPLWGGENVSASGDQIGPCHEEGCGPSHSLHGEGEGGEAETDGEYGECMLCYNVYTVQVSNIINK